MRSFKLPLAAAAAILTVGIAVPAAAQPIHNRTVVTKTVVSTHHEGRGYHHSRKVCSNYWSHHKRIQKCRWVRN